MKFKTLPLTLLTLMGLNLKGQVKTLVNKISENITGQSDTGKIAPLRKVNNTYVVSSNQKISTTQNDFKTTALNGNVTSLWSQLYNASNKKALTTAMTSDNNGNIYIAGTTYINSSNSQDLTVIKYNSQGQQKYVKHYNGPGNNYDAASGIVADNNGNVYVTGASVGNFPSFLDYVTLKLDSMGITQWTSRYNFSNGMDIPTDLLLDNSGNVIVSGSSASSSMNNNSDFTTVKYNASTGAQMAVQRQNNPGTAKDMVTAQTKDANGNIYTTGTTSSDGINYNVQTIKYDANMNPVWVKTFDPYGKYDTGSDIEVDNLGNVIVTGYATKTNLAKMLMVLSYNSNGNLNWKALKDVNGEGVKVVIKSSNEIFIGGNININGNQDMAILRYNNTGGQNLEKIYNGASNLKDQLLDMLVDGNFIVVSGLTNNGTIDQNVTVKYEYKDFIHNTALGNDFKYLGNELIINFNPNSLKMTKINNRDFLFGSLNDFVQDSICDKIDIKVGNGFNCNRYVARKIHLTLTEADSISYTRMGTYIKVPKFYADLVLSLPENFSPKPVTDSIRKMNPVVFGGDLNHILEPTGTDSLYYKQASLHPISAFAKAHINVDSCWAITSGVPSIRVGVYDTGIQFNHLDFAGINYGGYNFASSTGLSNTDDGSHGSNVASIIGARRNNTIGIKGIAGGDADSAKIGVSIYDCDVINTSGNVSFSVAGVMNDVLEAIQIGATGAPTGYALNIMNHSYKLGAGFVAQKVASYQNMISYASRNGVAFVCSKGNLQFPVSTIPADWNPEIVSAVGSSGNDGNWCKTNVNCNNASSYGRNIDFLAPGSDSIVHTHAVLQGFNQEQYESFSGTSAAAPHVSGVMALMMSYWNKPTPHWDNLVHEDCEELLKRTATDLTSPTYSNLTQGNLFYTQSAGFDSISGYGKINAFQALKKLNKNYYKIRHIDNSHFSSSTTQTFATKYSNVKVNWGPSYGGIPSGYRTTNVYELTTTYTYSLNPNESVLGYWPLYVQSCGWNGDTARLGVDKPYYTEVISANQTTAILKTWRYQDSATFVYYPNACFPAKSAFSLWTYDPTGTIGINEKTYSESNFKLHPNPNQGQFKITFDTEIYKLLTYKIFDILGREIKVNDFKTQFGRNEVNIEFQGSYGMYIIKVYDGTKQVYTAKLIKNND